MLNIKVVGPGCMNCQKLADMCKEIIEEHQIEAEFEKITDINKFADLGILMTPGLLLNNTVVVSGKLPTKSTLTHWIMESSK
jgi:small redox-active disulfide protein 2